MVNGPDYAFLESIEDLQVWWEVYGDAALRIAAAKPVMDVYELPVRIPVGEQGRAMRVWLEDRLRGNAHISQKFKADGTWTLILYI